MIIPIKGRITIEKRLSILKGESNQNKKTTVNPTIVDQLSVKHKPPIINQLT